MRAPTSYVRRPITTVSIFFQKLSIISVTSLFHRSQSNESSLRAIKLSRLFAPKKITLRIDSSTSVKLIDRMALHEKYLYREDLSRKGAKAQSAAAFLKGFLCAFAPLREKYSFPKCDEDFS